MSSARKRRGRTAHRAAAAPAAESDANPPALVSQGRQRLRRTPAATGGGPAGRPERKEKRDKGETTSGCC